jgi:hypothetical protein
LATLSWRENANAFMHNQLEQIAGPLHGLTQVLARHALPTGVALGRNHHHGGPTISRDADRLTLRGFHHLAKPFLASRANSALQRNGPWITTA